MKLTQLTLLSNKNNPRTIVITMLGFHILFSLVYFNTFPKCRPSGKIRLLKFTMQMIPIHTLNTTEIFRIFFFLCFIQKSIYNDKKQLPLLNSLKKKVVMNEKNINFGT